MPGSELSFEGPAIAGSSFFLRAYYMPSLGMRKAVEEKSG
jgi:hypothetical protein